jgi:DNA-binding MarR family transcriptional regulator
MSDDPPPLSPLQAKLANLLGAVSLGVADRLRAVTDAALERGGETAAALVVIGMTPGLTVADLADAVGLSHPGAVRAIDRLQRDGLVQRARGAGDKRTVSLALTPAGEAARDRVLAARAAVLAPLVHALDAGDALKVGAALDTLVGTMADTVGEARALCRLCQQDWCGKPGCKSRRLRG